MSTLIWRVHLCGLEGRHAHLATDIDEIGLALQKVRDPAVDLVAEGYVGVAIAGKRMCD